MFVRFAMKKALVTGAGKGIGRGVALKLAECGADVLAVSRTQSDLDELSKQNHNIKTLCLDIGNWEDTKSALQSVGPLDLLVNNAGVSHAKEFGSFSEKEFDEVYNTNVKAMFNISQMVVNGMKARGQGGSIVNLASLTGICGAPYTGLYGSSKGAVVQLSRSMAAELGPHKIRVNCVCPTIIQTRMTADLFEPSNSELLKFVLDRTPLKKLGEVADVVDPVVFLLSDKASLITGVVLPIDSGVSSSF